MQNQNIKSFINLSKEDQVNFYLNIPDNEKDIFLKKLKKEKSIVHMKLLSAIKSKENIDSSIKQYNKLEESSTYTSSEIDLNNIMPNPFQPRKEFDKSKLDSLALSIQKEGLLQDIVVTKNLDKAGHFIIIAGERRWRAFKINKSLYPNNNTYNSISVKILENISDIDLKKKAVIENLSREDMNIIETADSFTTLKESGMRLIDIQEVTGKSTSYISRMTIISTMDQLVKNKIIEYKIKSTSMLEYIIINVKNDIEYQLLLIKKIDEGMKMSELKSLIRHHYNNKINIKTDKSDTKKLDMTKEQYKKVNQIYKKMNEKQKLIADDILNEIITLQTKLINIK